MLEAHKVLAINIMYWLFSQQWKFILLSFGSRNGVFC